MSLKDKTFQTPVPRWDSTEEKPTWIEKDVVLLSDAEEEINHIEDVWVAVNNGKTLVIKEQGEEIQTLVELLGESKTQLESAAWEIGNKLLSEHDVRITESTATDTSCLIVANRITQTLKKYE